MQCSRIRVRKGAPGLWRREVKGDLALSPLPLIEAHMHCDSGAHLRIFCLLMIVVKKKEPYKNNVIATCTYCVES